MSEENILNLEEEPSEPSQPGGLVPAEHWEQELFAGTARLLRDAVSPIGARIENLRNALADVSASLNRLTDEAQISSEVNKIVLSVNGLVSEELTKSSENQRQQLEEARRELADEWSRRLEERSAEIREESASRILELETLLKAGREALELAVKSNAASSGSDRMADVMLAINDINAQRTQADTLSALVQHATSFAPRLLFFVVRSGVAVGWRAAGFSNGLDDESVSTLSVAVDETTLIGRALLGTLSESGPASLEETERVLGRFAAPAPMQALAIPLVVRGRAAAVLYVDTGNEPGGAINTAALEIIVQAGSMGIELLPTRRGEPGPPNPKPNTTAARGTTPLPRPSEEAPQAAPPPTPFNPAVPLKAAVTDPTPDRDRDRSTWPERGRGWGMTRELGGEPDASPETSTVAKPAAPPSEISWGNEPSPIASEVPSQVHSLVTPVEVVTDEQGLAAVDSSGLPRPASTDEMPPWSSVPMPEVRQPVAGPAVDTLGLSTSPERVTKPVPEFERGSRPVGDTLPPGAPPPQTTESEQRAHNDARRFARLLVSEIKLYNGAKVSEGRRNYDLYSRLAEEISRSRRVYEKRVSPAVAARFDYFYDELVQTLADGDKEKLGVDCPGPQLR